MVFWTPLFMHTYLWLVTSSTVHEIAFNNEVVFNNWEVSGSVGQQKDIPDHLKKVDPCFFFSYRPSLFPPHCLSLSFFLSPLLSLKHVTFMHSVSHSELYDSLWFERTTALQINGTYTLQSDYTHRSKNRHLNYGFNCYFV